MDQKIMDRFFKGQCTEEEMKEVMKWMHSDASTSYLSKRMEEFWDREDPSDVTESLSADRIAQRAINTIFEPEQDLTDVVTGRTSGFIWKVAAAIVFFLAVGFLFRQLITSDPEQPSVTEDVPLIIKQNPKGQKSKVFLPDGSTVWLNSESRLSYAKGFRDHLRQVHLDGEAFFEVVRNAEQPFIVQTGKARIQVLGTKFNVNAYRQASGTAVSLVEGKVRVVMERANNGDNAMELSPGEAVLIRSGASDMSRFQFNPQEHIGWKDGVLYFNKDDLNTVISKLERWYGVDIKLRNDDRKVWSFTGEYKNEYLENVLMNMSFTRDFDFEINNNEVIISFK
ncbi:MAG: FecR domain-containing protein [Cytophagales bacterium]|nr:FecR domain-containing protein [Cytophagales bacterium]